MALMDNQLVLIIPEGKVRDYVDGTIRNDTPEEYVRQTVEKRLVNEHKYNKERIAVEYHVQIGSGRKRADIVIFPEGATAEEKKDQQNISIIIECKKEAVKPTDKDNGLEQLKSYMSACNNCEWGMWTNGLHKTVYRKTVDETGHFVFVNTTTSLPLMARRTKTNAPTAIHSKRPSMTICFSRSELVTTSYISTKVCKNSPRFLSS